MTCDQRLFYRLFICCDFTYVMAYAKNNLLVSKSHFPSFCQLMMGEYNTALVRPYKITPIYLKFQDLL